MNDLVVKRPRGRPKKAVTEPKPLVMESAPRVDGAMVMSPRQRKELLVRRTPRKSVFGPPVVSPKVAIPAMPLMIGIRKRARVSRRIANAQA